eukprot:CAMPEP_0197515712 /NCGR_PEP_ID=MMETSP1318-20131121/757_1 /TAXON_ID=552666 /ORGANISM="Partenskyella glossopodia, Strain RCC365" /LENGTH=557 /DNA_ID=CAMNT_0043064159 /DNA_START=193 /DNA_END=1866 /DNA_ORIENTATION=+
MAGYMLGDPPGNVKDAIDTILISWKKVDDERVNWSLEKAQLESKVERLEESLEMHERVQKKMVQRIKMLEYALNKQENGLGESFSGLEIHKENGVLGLQKLKSKRMKYKTLPTYFPKGRLTKERIQAIVEDLMQSKNISLSKGKQVEGGGGANSAEGGLLKAAAAAAPSDDRVLQDENDDAAAAGGGYDIKDEEPVKLPAPSKAKAASLDVVKSGPATGEYKKLQEVDAKKLPKWTPITGLRSHLDGVRSVSFHPKEPYLFSGSEDGTAKLWNMERVVRKKKASKKQEPWYTFRGHTGMVTSTAVTDKMLFSGGVDGKLFVWGIPDPDQNQYTTYGTCSPFNLNCFEHPDAVWGIYTSGKHVFAAAADGNVTMWEANLDDQKSAKRTFTAESKVPTSVVVGPSGTQLMAAYTCGSVGVFDIETGKEISMMKGASKSVVMGLSGHPFLELCVSANLDGSFQIFDPTQGRCVDAKQNAHRDAVTSVSIGSSGVAMATASHDQSIRIWDIRKIAIMDDMDPNQHRKKYDEAIHCVAHHPTTPLLASCGADSVVKVFLGSM